ncbi:hypothetical protein [Periweissella fabalis]|uniref:Uncharacterized protein n=1 Tax=Periweissella fabalis TaxID=1070421 RepID=A0A7X6S2W5_9LACO|nr:hypothetical protein [Periweissella fabalis]MCM0599108.1 hypothetical protein [Periweissella fabalis]NKZ23387.1 hypothetical protein [Periweissella fabalis]
MREATYVTYLDFHSEVVLSWNISLNPSMKFMVDPLDKFIKNEPNPSTKIPIHSD